MNNPRKIYKDITAETKLIGSLKLYYAAKELKRNALKALYPHLSFDKIELKLKEIFSNARN